MVEIYLPRLDRALDAVLSFATLCTFTVVHTALLHGWTCFSLYVQVSVVVTANRPASFSNIQKQKTLSCVYTYVNHPRIIVSLSSGIGHVCRQTRIFTSVDRGPLSSRRFAPCLPACGFVVRSNQRYMTLFTSHFEPWHVKNKKIGGMVGGGHRGSVARWREVRVSNQPISRVR